MTMSNNNPQENGAWFPWSGKIMPFGMADVNVTVKLRNGIIITERASKHKWVWGHRPLDHDVIEYWVRK